MIKLSTLPISLRLFLGIVGSYFVVAGLYAASSIFIPITVAILLSYFLLPFVNYLEKKRFPPILAVLTSLLVGILLIAGLIALFSFQLNGLIADLPLFREEIITKINRIQEAIQTRIGVDPASQIDWVKARAADALSFNASSIGSTLRTTTGLFSTIALIPVYTFFILLYRKLIQLAFLSLFQKNATADISTMLGEIQSVVQHYLIGLAVVMYIVAVLNTIGLFILGIEHALFFGVLAALLTVIPYIGIIIGAALPTIVAFITKDSLWYPVAVIAVFTLIQFIEDNLIAPNVVGHRVKLNPLFALLAVIIGGQLWGIWGMIVFLPIFAVIKIVCDHIEVLHPIGMLMGWRSNNNHT